MAKRTRLECGDCDTPFYLPTETVAHMDEATCPVCEEIIDLDKDAEDPDDDDDDHPHGLQDVIWRMAGTIFPASRP